MNFSKVKVGDKLVCVNPDGWAFFKLDGVYTVTELWGLPHFGDYNIDLDGKPVSGIFSDDFEPYVERS